MRVELLPYRPEFLDAFYLWRSQDSSLRHNPIKPATRSQVEAMLITEGSDLSDLKKYEAYRWFVEADGALVGNVSLKNISHMMMYGELGYGMGESFQGRGIGGAAVRALVQKIFDETQMRKLFAHVHDKNVPSCKILEKIGFQREGLLREHYIINGQPENEIFYGLLKKDWITLRRY